MSPGKQALESDAAVPMAAGARLETMRRRVRLSRLALFTSIAAGPVALGVAVMSGPTTVAAAPSDKPTAVRSVGLPRPTRQAMRRCSSTRGCAAERDDANSARARLAQLLAPDVELPDPAAGARPKPATVTAVRSVGLPDGRVQRGSRRQGLCVVVIKQCD
ncbi:hypothetical protein ACIO93_44045 [Streptomyces sp. NPDC087903]|uniref:hypothetical protein n=1 Tax=Streptomyces sp. NPDC087903 TaxID=3365819 RepID=UPI00381A1A42